MPAPLPRLGRFFVLGALALVVATACSSSSTPRVPTLQTPGSNSSASPVLTLEQAAIAYTRCMRDQGISMADPVVDSGGVSIKPPEDGLIDKRSYGAADDLCRHFLRDAAAAVSSPVVVDPAVQDALLAYARCMREHGVNMADPVNGEPASVTVVIGGNSQPPTQDKVTRAAADAACSDLLPGKPGTSMRPSAGSASPSTGARP